ncbi:polyprenyl synthetase family protein [Actinocatenispora comari]|jgi:heptaprenyl diphosphate synthase|uniref:Geranylgeranyl pyrophosphate synthase n=1 Tax=Actinocatenispora comari TaxID=2807577 RepID=A0A8J4EI18_9ACTN|nr:polyprenyl synthetase family protein [Actinocatenispora comari]GIL25627.1 geranylgeranyl pyrophosphate synthase [Actinocatenispora comari]
MAAAELDFDDAELSSALTTGLGEVEQALLAAVSGADPYVTEMARHLTYAGGKRTRPLLVLLGAHFGKPDVPEVLQAAVVVELTHLATLYHDDVMDEASVRRGAQSANARFGNSVAILTGDYLFARASDIVSELGPEAVRIQARTFARLVHGQIRETAGPRGADPVQHYLDVLAEKTGALIATSARFGAMFGGADPAMVAAIAEFGETFGMAFQLSDDLLDIASDTDQSGKTPGTDLREGVLTLPVLYALGSDDPDSRRLAEIVQGPVTDDELHAEALTLLRDSVGMDRARATVRDYADRARAQLEALPDVPARAALDHLCSHVAARTR